MIQVLAFLVLFAPCSAALRFVRALDADAASGYREGHAAACSRAGSAATAPEVADHDGRYYDKCAEKRPSRLADDADLARTLWEKSLAWTGLPPA